MKFQHLLMGLAVTVLNVSAQQAKSASVDYIVEVLAPAPSFTRNLRNLTPESRKIDLMVQFEFNSSKLMDISKPLLTSVA